MHARRSADGALTPIPKARKMKKTSLALLAVVAAVAFAAPAHAQLPNVTPFSFELRGGLVFPTGDFGETAEDVGAIESGYTVGANAT